MPEVRPGGGRVSTERHHIIPQQRIKNARSATRVKRKIYGEASLSEAEERLIHTSERQILNDRRNIRRLTPGRHTRAHHGARPYRITLERLPEGIADFAREYALESALIHELDLAEIPAAEVLG
jgi:hypothetical protein